MTDKPKSIQDLIDDTHASQGHERANYVRIQMEIEKRIRLLEGERKDKQKILSENTAHADSFNPIKEVVVVVDIDKLTGAIDELIHLHGNYKGK